MYITLFSPSHANWHSSSRPAGGTINQLEQHMLLFDLLSESRAVISSMEKHSISARIQMPIMLFFFASLTEHVTSVCRFKALFLHLFFSCMFIAF